MQVYDLVSQSMCCQFSEKSAPPAKVPPIEFPKPAECWTNMGLDNAGPFADTPSHQKFIVMVIDYASNYPECLLTADIRSSGVIRWLETVFSCCGDPTELSDKGLQFTSAEFTAFLKKHGINHICCAIYSSTENGLVKVVN